MLAQAPPGQKLRSSQGGARAPLPQHLPDGRRADSGPAPPWNQALPGCATAGGISVDLSSCLFS